MTVREAGRKGGEVTAQRHGPQFYEEIGRKAVRKSNSSLNRASARSRRLIALDLRVVACASTRYLGVHRPGTARRPLHCRQRTSRGSRGGPPGRPCCALPHPWRAFLPGPSPTGLSPAGSPALRPRRPVAKAPRFLQAADQVHVLDRGTGGPLHQVVDCADCRSHGRSARRSGRRRGRRFEPDTNRSSGSGFSSTWTKGAARYHSGTARSSRPWNISP